MCHEAKLGAERLVPELLREDSGRVQIPALPSLKTLLRERKTFAFSLLLQAVSKFTNLWNFSFLVFSGRPARDRDQELEWRV